MVSFQLELRNGLSIGDPSLQVGGHRVAACGEDGGQGTLRRALGDKRIFGGDLIEMQQSLMLPPVQCCGNKENSGNSTTKKTACSGLNQLKWFYY